METASICLVLMMGTAKFLAAISLVFSINRWRRHVSFPYREQALIAQLMFGMVAAHIFFRLLCIFWQPVFGAILLFIDVASTPFLVLLAILIKKAVDAVDQQP